MIEAQIRFVERALASMRRRGSERIEVRPEAQRAFNEQAHRAHGGDGLADRRLSRAGT